MSNSPLALVPMAKSVYRSPTFEYDLSHHMSNAIRHCHPTMSRSRGLASILPLLVGSSKDRLDCQLILSPVIFLFNSYSRNNAKQLLSHDPISSSIVQSTFNVPMNREPSAFAPAPSRCESQTSSNVSLPNDLVVAILFCILQNKIKALANDQKPCSKSSSLFGSSWTSSTELQTTLVCPPALSHCRNLFFNTKPSNSINGYQYQFMISRPIHIKAIRNHLRNFYLFNA